MEMELTLEMTYDDIFNNSFGLSKSYLANILKVKKKKNVTIFIFLFFLESQFGSD